MKMRNSCFALAAVLGVVGFAVHAASGATMRVQVVDQRGLPLRDAVVELDAAGGRSGAITFPWRMAMAQKDMQFVPGTLIVAKGSTVAFPNLDRLRHSVYSFSPIARFTIDLYGRDQTRSQAFPIAGTVALGCNIHDGMRGYIRVVETPFAGKTDSDGYVTLNALPMGSARITVWHPRLRAPGNEMTQVVAVAANNGSRKVQVQLR
jgi:plastocyanin